MLFVPRSLWHIAFFPAARHAELVTANRHAEIVSASNPLPKRKKAKSHPSLKQKDTPGKWSEAT